MGFATSITVAILFLSFMVIGSIAYPVMFKSYENVQDSITEKHKLQMSQLNTAINISNIANSGSNMDITVKNAGSIVLNASKSSIIVNGSYVTYTATPAGLWVPGREAVFRVAQVSSVPVKVITENGISDTDTSP